MDLKLFEDLVALARERSFVRAAEARHVTHPAFGRRIRALEAWAGVTLVERGRSPMHLTAAGQSLLLQVQDTFEELLPTREQLRSRQGASSRRGWRTPMCCWTCTRCTNPVRRCC